MSFDGFPKKTLTFLRGIRANNDKAWFDSHRTDYEDFYLGPAKDFVVAAGSALHAVAPHIRAEPRVNGSIFRINRDIRFTRDKRPYKDHLDLWFWEGDRKGAVSGYFLRLTPTHLGIGAGAHGFHRDLLGAYRDAVVDAKAGRSLRRSVAAVSKAGWVVEGEHYKRTPAGYTPRDATEEKLLRHRALWVGEDERIPPVVHTPDLVDHALARWKQMAPIHRWLVDNLG